MVWGLSFHIFFPSFFHLDWDFINLDTANEQKLLLNKTFVFSTGPQRRYTDLNTLSRFKIWVTAVVGSVLCCCFPDMQIFQTAIRIIYQRAAMCSSCSLTDRSCSGLGLMYAVFGKLGYVYLSCCVFSLESSTQPAAARQEHICLLTHCCVFSGETSLLEKKMTSVKKWAQHSQYVCSSPPERER